MGMAADELYFKPRMQVINQDQIDQIHCATVDVLERTGVDIPHKKALDMLSGKAIHSIILRRSGILKFLTARFTISGKHPVPKLSSSVCRPRPSRKWDIVRNPCRTIPSRFWMRCNAAGDDSP
jgi:hypothetical protein